MSGLEQLSVECVRSSHRQGRTRIAEQFITGTVERSKPSPGEMVDKLVGWVPSPFGDSIHSSALFPGDESSGHLQRSLWDLFAPLRTALRVAVLASAFFSSPQLVSAQSFEFTVEHQHALRNCRGTLTITPDKIEYKTTHKKDSRTWRYIDIRQIKVESPTVLEIVTYEDQRRMLGRDRIFKFRLLVGQITPELSALLMAEATHPLVTSVMPMSDGAPTFELAVKHLHTLGGCEGVLRIYPDRVTYESRDRPSDSRFWRYTDIEHFGHPARYRFEITTYEDRFGGPTKVYNFQLKEEFPARAYDYLWVRVHPTKFYPYEKTAPPELPSTPTNRQPAR